MTCTLGTLTDGQRRALADPAAAWRRRESDGDWNEARAADLVGWDAAARVPKLAAAGTALVQQAAALARGLSDEELAILHGRQPHSELNPTYVCLRRAGLMTRDAGRFVATPGGRMVLELRPGRSPIHLFDLRPEYIEPLLGPADCDETDFRAAERAGLVTITLRRDQEGVVDEVCGDEARTELGELVLAAAQRVALELPPELQGVLGDPDDPAWLDDPLHGFANERGFLYFSGALASMVARLRARAPA